MTHTGPCSTIGSEADCRSRVCEFDPARPYTFVGIDNEIFYMVILLLPLIQEGLVPVTSENMSRKYWLTCLGKSVVRLTDCLNMTITVDWDIKLQTKQTNK